MICIPESIDQLMFLISTINKSPNETALVVSGGDNGIAKEGVSRYQFGDTARIMKLSASFHSPVSKLCLGLGMKSYFLNIGCSSKINENHGVSNQYYAGIKGTNNILTTQAMSEENVEKIINLSYSFVQNIPFKQICLGEVGIGNTIVSSAITAICLNLGVNDCIGTGSGVKNLDHKKILLDRIISRHNQEVGKNISPIKILASLGSSEIAWSFGVLLAGTKMDRIFILDGFNTAVAALLATYYESSVRSHIFASHLSREPGHKHILKQLKLRPFLDLDLALGQGFGAALGYSFIYQTRRTMGL